MGIRGGNPGPVFDLASGFGMGAVRVSEWILWGVSQRRVWVLFGAPLHDGLAGAEAGAAGPGCR